MQASRRSGLGLGALVVFFAAGACIAALSAAALAAPGSPFDAIWRINPEAQHNFLAMGRWAIPLLVTVALGCLLAAVGLARRKRWGHRLAVTILAANLLGDLGNAVVRGDLRTLIGIPIAGAMLWYLASPRVRDRFAK